MRDEIIKDIKRYWRTYLIVMCVVVFFQSMFGGIPNAYWLIADIICLSIGCIAGIWYRLKSEIKDANR